MIRYPLIVQVPDASNQRMMALPFRPSDSLGLRPGCRKHVISVILDDIIGDRTAFWSAFWPSFDVHVCHITLPDFLMRLQPNGDATVPTARASPALAETIGPVATTG